MSKLTNVRHQLIDSPADCEAFYYLKITRIQIDANNGSKEKLTCRVISSTELDLLLPPIKRAPLLLFGYRSLAEAVARSKYLVAAMNDFNYSTKQIRSGF